MIYEVHFPIAYHTVDMAIMKRDGNKFGSVLLVQKHAEVESGLWRFSGGFVDPSDDSAEHACLREANEETGMRFKPVETVEYIGSVKVTGDKRYENSPHKIITSFYAVEHSEGDAGVGFDDVAKTKWFTIAELRKLIDDEKTNPIHYMLFVKFLKYFERKEQEAKLFELISDLNYKLNIK